MYGLIIGIIIFVMRTPGSDCTGSESQRWWIGFQFFIVKPVYGC